ncbi:MAG: AAA family ATPase [Candidatus Hodarchaeota archaeon]
MRQLIGITGQMGSGKSTAAAYIVKKYDFILMQLSGKMREIGRELGLEITRDLLQGMGKFFREFDDDVWVKYLAKKVQESSVSIVVDDIRRRNEVDYLKPLGFKFIRIESLSEKRRMRIETRMKKEISDQDWNRWSIHLTEIEVSQLPVNYVIQNDSTMKDLTDQIDDVLSKLD